MTPAWLVAALLALPVYRHDRAPELADAKAQQMAEVADAIAEASRGSVWRARMLLVMGRFESGFALHITRGECGAHECDASRVRMPDGKTVVVFRAHSNWQLHEGACSSREAWLAARTDVRVAAREAARAIDRARGMCRSVVAKGESLERATFAALAGRGCRGWFRGLDQRVAAFQRLEAK